MKVFAGLIAAAAATLTADDCPNDAWELNSDSTKCVPKASEITVTCSATKMNVKFSEKLVYVELDSTHSGEATSSVNTKTDDCTATQSSSGEYDFDITLDGCGTTVEQSGGSITFKNTIIGNTDALKVDNIVTTESLELAVECVFTDNFDLKVEDIGIEAADHEIAGSDATGKFDTVFTLKSYTDAGFTSLSTTSNAVTIGKPVYNRVEVTSLPSNVDFYVTDCTAADTAAADGTTYKVIQDGCLDKLLDVKDITDKLVGDSSTKQVDFSFNGFTFSDTSDTVYLSCKINLCATNDSGDKIEAGCGYEYIAPGGTCTDATSTLGYNLA